MSILAGFLFGLTVGAMYSDQLFGGIERWLSAVLGGSIGLFVGLMMGSILECLRDSSDA